jgi:hypothetical protein
MTRIRIFARTEKPFGIRWERWAAIWCRWQLSMPRNNHPALDKTGERSDQFQDDPKVWFLTGTFGNSTPIIRNCRIPTGRAILCPVIYKEDSFVEDTDLRTNSDLLIRAQAFVDKVTCLHAKVDGEEIHSLYQYRVHSEFFDLIFPKNSVYDVEPGRTTAVCDGYWIFMKPPSPGRHEIHFAGTASIEQNDIVTEQIKNDSIYAPFLDYMEKYSSFKVEVIYKLIVQ